MKIVAGKTEAGKNVSFELDVLLTTRLLIQANSGAGKSWLLRRLMEELFGHVQVIAIDPEGEFATLREKFDYVLVGKGGETPAHISTAAEVAHKLLELRASAVCDLYEMPAADRHEWVKRFLDALIDAPKKLWHPVVIIVDEAQMFCPEKGAGESVASGAMVDLTTRGRKRGFCPVWATQRLAKVSKDATSMLLNRLVGGTFEDVDIKRALDLLSVAPDDKREVSQQLKTFDSGWFFAFGRAVSKERLLFKVGPVQTSHPKPGSSKHAAEPPEPSEKIRAMLGALADIPKIAEEKARTLEDYKRQIRDLKTELVQTKKAQPKLAAPAKPSGLDPAQLRQLNSDIDALQKKYNALKKETEGLMKIIAKVVALGFEDMAIKPEEVKAAFEAVAVQIGKLAEKKIQQRGVELESLKKDIKQVQLRLSKFLSIQEKAITVQVEVKHNKPFTVTPPVRVPRPQRALQTGDLSQYQSDVLNAQAQIVALGRSKVKIKMLAPLANKSYTSSSFKQSLRDLRDAGYLIFVDSDTVSLTDAGRAIAPEADPIQSPQEMLARCKSVVSVYDGKLLEALSQTYPEPVPFDTLANLSNVSPTSSSFKQSLRDLRDVGMAKFIGKDQARLAGWVMLEEDE